MGPSWITCFFDVNITVVDGIYKYKNFDKRVNYPNFFAFMSDLYGNIPEYGLDVSVLYEFLRIR